MASRITHIFTFFLRVGLSLIALALPLIKIAHAANPPVERASFLPSILLPEASSRVVGHAAPDLVFGLFIGVMLAASFYLFFIWIVMRDRSQASLMFLLMCLCVNMASTNDMLVALSGLHSQTVINLIQNYSMILSYIFGLFFTLYFLEVEANLPHMTTPFYALAALLGLLLAYAAFDERPVHFALPTLGAFSLAFALLAGLKSLHIGISGSLSHIIAFSFFLLAGLATPLYDLGYIADIETSKQLTYASFSMAALLFAIVIAGQFAARQEEKERALAISNERFALAARGSNEGLFDWNLITGDVYFSDQFRRILGKRLEQNTKGLRSWIRTILPADRRIVFAHLRKFRDSLNTTTINFEYRIARAGEGWRWLHTKTVATRDPRTGRIKRFVGSIGDITSRKRGEAALKASEARFRSITEAHPVPVMIIEIENHNVLYASPGAEALLGLPHSTLTSHKISRFITKAEERLEIIQAMRQGREINLKEVTVTRGDGNTLTAALSARRINYQNQPAMVMGLYDLTERKKAEEQIAKQQEALQQSEKMAALGGLLAGVAHELNNPLSVVVGQSSLLIEGEQEARVKSRAEKIVRAADRCSRIVKSFLAIARRKPPERKLVDLNSILHASLELLNYQMKNENIELDLELDAALPPINGDPDQLTQVFTNIALNATQAMHDWKGKRHIKITSRFQEAGKAVISFIDTGPGIPVDIRKRIFEPFFTTKSGQGGTGIGLSLCLNIIESHGGALCVDDTSGGGATFVVTLPTVATENKALGDTDPNTVQLNSHLRILIVDDEVELSQTLADLLEPEGHYIDLAANGEIALNKLRKKEFDVIISDLRMPVMDGPTLYENIGQSLPKYLNRIIFVTGDTLSPHVHEFLNQNPVPVIEKPYRLIDVKGTLALLLKDGTGAGSIEAIDSPPCPVT